MEDDNNGIILKGKNIWIFFGIFALFFLSIWLFKKGYKNEIISSYSITQGQIISYSDNLGKTVEGHDIYVEYSYQIDSVIYTRRIKTKEIKDCVDSPSGIGPICAGKRFWVAYSNNDHNKSLINLNIELQNKGQVEFSGNLEEFR